MRILIVKLSSIGDVVHTLPAAAFLRRALTGTSIAWVVEKRAAAILEGCPAIDELIEIDTRKWRSHISSRSTLEQVRSLLARLRGPRADERIDVAIDFQGLIKSGLVALASGAARRVGFETAELREKASRLFLTQQVETSRFGHVIEKNLALARALLPSDLDMKQPTLEGYAQAEYEFPIAVSPEDERYVDEAILDHSRRFAIINPGGGWATKLWPPERYAQVADWLRSCYGLASFVTYGPGEEHLAESVAAHSRCGAARPLASTLKQFVALARRAELFVGGDTGPLHLAAASGTPIVGLYGPTAPQRNGPFNRMDVSVGRDLWCRADCHRRSCWHWQCMDIALSDVLKAISTRMERPRGVEVSSAVREL